MPTISGQPYHPRMPLLEALMTSRHWDLKCSPAWRDAGAEVAASVTLHPRPERWHLILVGSSIDVGVVAAS